MDEITNLIGDRIPWRNEEEMIREPAEMRRRHATEKSPSRIHEA